MAASPFIYADLAAPSHMLRLSADTYEMAVVRILRGRDAIVSNAEALEEFAGASGQQTALHGLRYTLDQEYAARKTPHLVCILSTPTTSDTLSPETLLGCVLFFEYRLGSWNTGLVATGDSSGIRTVIGPAVFRAQIAAIAAAHMLEEARIVLCSFRQSTSPLPDLQVARNIDCRWSARTREVRDHLELRPTYQATLATLGRRTRNHLRYYRRRVHLQLGAEFIPDVRADLTNLDLQQLNAASLDPISPTSFALQYQQTAELRGGFVCGLRATTGPDPGRWLSLAGGWRQGSATLVQWQSNAAGFERLSLGTAFRAFLLEHEVALGTTELRFHNGTSHSMQHAFQTEYVVDLLLRRPSLGAWLAVHLVPALSRRSSALADRGNFLAEALRHPGLTWRPCSPAAPPDLLALKPDHPIPPNLL